MGKQGTKDRAIVGVDGVAAMLSSPMENIKFGVCITPQPDNIEGSLPRWCASTLSSFTTSKMVSTIALLPLFAAK